MIHFTERRDEAQGVFRLNRLRSLSTSVKAPYAPQEGQRVKILAAWTFHSTSHSLHRTILICKPLENGVYSLQSDKQRAKAPVGFLFSVQINCKIGQ